MKIFFRLLTLTFLIPLAAEAVELPSLVCREQQVLKIDPSTLKIITYPSSSLYRFTHDGLFLSDKDREEYFYNKIKFVERDLQGYRFTSAHKTFIFDNEFKRASSVHINGLEVSVSQLLCTRTEPGVK